MPESTGTPATTAPTGPRTPATGTPVWIDYGTDDPDAARTFYAELFGWSFADQGEEFGHYELIANADPPAQNRVGGFIDTSGIPAGPCEAVAQDGEAKQAAAPAPEAAPPAAWTVYLAVDDATKRAEAAADAGATVLVDPMPVGALGTMALLADPTGAQIGMWQPGTLASYDVTMKPGAPVWFEQMSADFAGSCRFYADVFGYGLVAMAPDGGAAGDDTAEALEAAPYATNGANGSGGSGICNAKVWLPAGAPAYWRVYFAVADANAAVRRIVELGGQVTDGPFDSPFGRVATVLDPLGATFQINQTSPA